MKKIDFLYKMMKNKNVFFRICLLLLVMIFTNRVNLCGQRRQELETRRFALAREINAANTLLNKTRENQKNTMNELLVLQAQIQKREELVKSINEEITIIDKNIKRNTEIVEALTFDLEQLKKDYGKLMKNVFRRRHSLSRLLFLFGAQNVADTYRRVQFVRRYYHYRKAQVMLIKDTQQDLSSKIKLLEKRKIEKEELLKENDTQKEKLQTEIKDKNNLVQNLRQDENKLKRELKEKEDSKLVLSSAIEDVIRVEVAEVKKKLRTEVNLDNYSAEKPKVNTAPSELDKKASSIGFKNKRGGLLWPVSGVITSYFGAQPHPVLSNITTQNNGIDISTNTNAQVKTVFEGEVVSVFFNPSFQNAVMVKHGDYYTVYSHLKETYVKTGQKVNTGQSLGTVYTDAATQKTEIHFEVWEGKQRLNPVSWLSR